VSEHTTLKGHELVIEETIITTENWGVMKVNTGNQEKLLMSILPKHRFLETHACKRKEARIFDNDNVYETRGAYLCENISNPLQHTMIRLIASMTAKHTIHNVHLLNDMYVYMEKEPCIMCAMALLHSRVKGVFFSQTSCDMGGFSKYRLHLLKEVNHRFVAGTVSET